MSTAIPDLWPSDIAAVAVAPPSPVTILRQQGYLLGQKTQNFVIGEVESGGSDRAFQHSFFISATLLNTRVHVFTVQHGIELYPAKIHTVWGKEPRLSNEAPDVTAFISSVSSILSAAEVRELVHSLLRQCRDIDEE